MKLKKYEEFVNEEINLKKALIGGALAASTLVGCDDAEMAKRQGGEWHNDQTTVQTDIQPMIKDTSEHFSKGRDEKIDKRSISDICHDHLIDTCSWYDRFVFNRRSTEPYKSMFGNSYQDLLKKWDDTKNDTGFKL